MEHHGKSIRDVLKDQYDFDPGKYYDNEIITKEYTFIDLVADVCYEKLGLCRCANTKTHILANNILQYLKEHETVDFGDTDGHNAVRERAKELVRDNPYQVLEIIYSLFEIKKITTHGISIRVPLIEDCKFVAFLDKAASDILTL